MGAPRLSVPKALFQRRVAWTNLELLIARGLYLCAEVGGIRTVAPFLRCVALQISLQRSTERMQRRRLVLRCVSYLQPQRGKPQILDASKMNDFYQVDLQTLLFTSA
ncbi:hypothetical protein AVEN_120202-1 [Araneus ventricosus]|uniref:Uncharacterized protein n=1 Tax=Araneus ventricosus TaxID=182803 RepID=A0A4Y2UJA6_ARAVE|nr:hypothetical protein AVEN_120202-1 [Araneus ventricosus]